jgi:hypothetical protein
MKHAGFMDYNKIYLLELDLLSQRQYTNSMLAGNLTTICEAVMPPTGHHQQCLALFSFAVATHNDGILHIHYSQALTFFVILALSSRKRDRFHIFINDIIIINIAAMVVFVVPHAIC